MTEPIADASTIELASQQPPDGQPLNEVAPARLAVPNAAEANAATEETVSSAEAGENTETRSAAVTEADPDTLQTGASGGAMTDTTEPWQLMRTLNALQDDIARGSGAALVAQRVIKERLSTFAADAPTELWENPKNAAALLAYTLSGGEPDTVQRVLQSHDFEPPFDKLLRGALAYIEGRESDAERHFEDVRTDRLPYSVRGPVYLALAALSVDDDPETTRQYLDRARYSAPGTLIEEAALRRAVLLATERDDINTFSRLTNRYVRKYRASVYAGNFRKRLSSAITRMAFIDEPDAFERLDEILGPMSDAGRQELFLVMARAAIENGSHKAARQAAERALQTAVPDSLDHRRARLYQAAAGVVDPERHDAAWETLNSLSPDSLSADDRALQTAAKALAASVSTLPEGAPSDEAIVALAEAAAAAAPTTASPEPSSLAEAAGAPGTPTPLDPTSPPGEVAVVELPEDGPFAAPIEIETRVAEALAAVDRMLEDAQ